MTRQDVYSAIDGERGYQDKKWGDLAAHPHEVGGWLTVLRHYLTKAEAGWAATNGDEAALIEIRKVAAITVACLEQHGCPRR